MILPTSNQIVGHPFVSTFIFMSIELSVTGIILRQTNEEIVDFV